jgi:hypothetical protein
MCEPDGDMRFSRRVATLIVGGFAVLAASVSACERKQVDEPESVGTYQLAVSRSPDRSSRVPLSGRLVAGRVYVFADPDAGVERVRLVLDAPSPSLASDRSEGVAPFELADSALRGAARPLDTTLLDNGLHTLTAVLDLSDGGTVTARASFSVFNPVKAAPTTRATATTTAPTTTTRPERAVPKLLFGMGPEADVARRSPLVRQAPVRMLTSWYNGPGDLAWMAGWKDSLVPRAYAAGYALHLIVYTGDPEGPVATPYGDACGRGYPLSSRFLDDMRQLARIFAGAAGGPRLYVSLFTEFQTYPCNDNAWNEDPAANAYYRALKDRYRGTLAVFHQLAPNAGVSLSWGGWQTRWDDPASGAGRSLFRHFQDVLRMSDFQSFQAMATDSNVNDIRAMVRMLGRYGPVMLAHYKPDNGSRTVSEADLRAILTDRFLTDVAEDGLFAMSFMDGASLGSSSLYEFVRRAVGRYARA